jgi:hypothetical protein
MKQRQKIKHLRSCRRKPKMGMKEANVLANRMIKQGHWVNAYRCPHCNGWHVGKMNNRQRVAAAFRELDREKRKWSGKKTLKMSSGS